MLTDAFVLALLSTGGLQLAFKKLPKRLQKFLIKHALVTDFLTFVITYLTLGGTLTALTAGAMVALFTSFMLEVANNPDKYEAILSLTDWAQEKIGEAMQGLNAIVRQAIGPRKKSVVAQLEPTHS